MLSLQTPGVYATVDFGPGTNVSSAFAVQRLFSPRGPLVNSEYYPGWLGELGAYRLHDPETDDIPVHAYTCYICSDHWSHPHSTVNSAHTVATLEAMLDIGARCLYMHFHHLHRSQVPFTAFLTFTCVFLTFTFTCAFFCIFTC